MMLVQNSALIVLFCFLLFNPLRALGALTTGFLEAEITLLALGDIFMDVWTKNILRKTQELFTKIQNQIENNQS